MFAGEKGVDCSAALLLILMGMEGWVGRQTDGKTHRRNGWMEPRLYTLNYISINVSK